MWQNYDEENPEKKIINRKSIFKEFFFTVLFNIIIR